MYITAWNTVTEKFEPVNLDPTTHALLFVASAGSGLWIHAEEFNDVVELTAKDTWYYLVCSDTTKVGTATTGINGTYAFATASYKYRGGCEVVVPAGETFEIRRLTKIAGTWRVAATLTETAGASEVVIPLEFDNKTCVRYDIRCTSNPTINAEIMWNVEKSAT